MSAVPERKKETRDGGGEGWTIEISRKGGRAEGAREWTNVLQSGWEGGIGEIQRAHGKNEEQHPSNSTKFLAAQVLHSVVGTGGIGGSRERHPSRRTRTQSAPVRNAATDKVLVLREERAGEPVKIEEIVDSGNVKTRTRTAPSLPRCWETLDFGARWKRMGVRVNIAWGSIRAQGNGKPYYEEVQWRWATVIIKKQRFSAQRCSETGETRGWGEWRRTRRENGAGLKDGRRSKEIDT
ncbi:hypothetical protein B0H14DRAFT_2631786 [Mycena olivaceomarginata]|nr:hypothetical protein B0H14DRAFT_2631786 [Mycena olivaceomarginata]